MGREEDEDDVALVRQLPYRFRTTGDSIPCTPASPTGVRTSRPRTHILRNQQIVAGSPARHMCIHLAEFELSRHGLCVAPCHARDGTCFLRFILLL